MDEHAAKEVKGDETVDHLPHKFSRIVWYFLARSGEISVEVISCRRCRRMRFHGSSILTSQTKYK